MRMRLVRNLFGLALLCALGGVLAGFGGSIPDLVSALKGAAPPLSRLITEQVMAILSEGYSRAPAVMLGLAGAAAVPMLWLGGLVVARYTRRRLIASETAARVRRSRQVTPGPFSRTPAWIELEGDERLDLETGREIICMGRDANNQFALGDRSIDHVEAVIQRTVEAEFVLIDVSGAGTVRVNGRQPSRAALKDGDRIDVGGGHVAFRRAPGDEAKRPREPLALRPRVGEADQTSAGAV